MFIKLIKYELFDLFKSRWIIGIFLFYFFVGYILSYFSEDFTKSIVGYTSISLITLPLFSLLLSSIYLYNNKNFIEFVLTQPIKRTTIFISIVLSITISLLLSFNIASFLPFFYFYGINFIHLKSILLISSIIPLFISLGMLLATIENDKLKGIGFSLVVWLFFCVFYDSILLYFIIVFSNYPIEKIVIFLTLINPIDTIRLNVLIDSGLYEIMGFVGKWLLKYFKNFWIISIFVSLFYSFLFLLLFSWIFKKKDF
ncbi:MAG: NosY protein [candidate division WOR-3 bacterium]